MDEFEDEEDYDYDDEEYNDMSDGILLAVNGSDKYDNAACFSFIHDLENGGYIDYQREVNSIKFKVPRTDARRDTYLKDFVSLANWNLDDWQVTATSHIFSMKFQSMRDRLVFFGFAHIPRGALESDDMLVEQYTLCREAGITADDAFIFMNYTNGSGGGHQVIGSNLYIKTLQGWKWQKWIDSIPWDVPAAQGYWQTSLVKCGPWLGFDNSGYYYDEHKWGIDMDFYKRLKTSEFYGPYKNAKKACEMPIYRPIGD